MKFEKIQSYLEGIPFIDPKRARMLYQFILEFKPVECLELGFAHGASSCYIAAALDEIGRGHLTSIDLISAMEWQKPPIEKLLSRTRLQKYVTIARERTSYTWFLKKKIEQQTTSNYCQPIYDFCFIDGSKNWTIDGCAFFLVDKLLKHDGWILFDDYNWTYGATGRTQTDGINHEKMGEDELNTSHIKSIFHLLIMQHPNYSEFKIQDGWWAWAHKVHSSSKMVKIETTISYRANILHFLKEIGEKWKGED